MRIQDLLVLSLVSLSLSSAASAATSVTTVETNPASVSATLVKNCLKAYDKFEAELPSFLSKINFVERASLVSASDWKATSQAADHVMEERNLFYSVTSTVQREFPMTMFPITVSRKRCLGIQIPGQEACADSVTVSMTGKKAVVYQKALELTRRNHSVWGSFTFAMSFAKASADTCTFSTSLTGLDTSYLWAKRHLIDNVDHTTVEARLFKGFVSWGVSILPVMEQ